MERAASPRLAIVVLIGVAALAGAAVATGTVPVAGSSADGTVVSDGGSAPADDQLSLATDEPADEDDENESDGSEDEETDDENESDGSEDEETDDEDEEDESDEDENEDSDDEDDSDGEEGDDSNDDGEERDDDDENRWPWEDDDDENDESDGDGGAGEGDGGEDEGDGDNENKWPWQDDDNESDDEDDGGDSGWPWEDDDNESDGGDVATTQEPVSTPESTVTSTPAETQTATATTTPSPTAGPTVTPTATSTATDTATSTATATPTPARTTTPTPTQSPTATATETPTPEPTPTDTPEPTDTPVQQSSSDDTPTATPTDTPGQQSSSDDTPTETPAPTATSTPQVGASTEQPVATSTEASFEIAETRVAGQTVSVGESVVVEARVRNPADSADRELVPLRVDGELVASKAATLDAGESDVITFERSFDAVGDHEIAVGGTARSTVSVVGSDTIEGPPTARNRTAVPASGELAPRSDRIEVVEAHGLPDWVRSDYNPSVETTLVNRGNRTAVHTLSVAIDGQPVANETVQVAPDTRRNVSVVFPAAEGEVTVDGATAGTLNVRDDPDVGTDTGPERTSAGGDGFGVGAAVAALLCAALLVLRARSNERSKRSGGS